MRSQAFSVEGLPFLSVMVTLAVACKAAGRMWVEEGEMTALTSVGRWSSTPGGTARVRGADVDAQLDRHPHCFQRRGPRVTGADPQRLVARVIELAVNRDEAFGDGLRLP